MEVAMWQLASVNADRMLQADNVINAKTLSGGINNIQ